MQELKGIKTGFDDLDDTIGGFENGHLIMLCGRPSIGKTAFVMSLIDAICVKETKAVLYFSLEMDKQQFASRVLMMKAGVTNKGELKDEEWTRLAATVEELSNSKLWIDDTTGITIDMIKEKTERFVQEKSVDLVVIDYLQLIDSGIDMETRDEEIAYIIENLKKLAISVDKPVLVLSQLAHSMHKENYPSLDDIKAYKSISPFLDDIILMYRDDYYDKDSPLQGICELEIAKPEKSRGKVVKIFFDRSHLRFENITN